jgi:cobalt/nickel transport system ATP-binding protein
MTISSPHLKPEAAQTNTHERLLALDSVRYTYPGGGVALDGVSLNIACGEKVALLGANGSGKSTLLKIMNGLIHPDSGRYVAYGQEITESSLRNEAVSFAFRRRVGFVFQNSDTQLFSATVREEIAFGPLQLGLPAEQVEQRIRDVAAMVEVTPLLDRAPYHLSAGEKKKVALASVLIINPEILLLDEPTSGLDPRSRQWLVGLIVTLHQAGKTIVTATHDLDIVRQVADRAVVMDEAHRIASEGSPETILADHHLLTRANLVHDHFHWHGSYGHSHPHHHGGEHDHTH